MIYYKNGNEDMKMMMKTCFPAIVEESEDERIRKELLNYLYDSHDDDEERARWIAWLEKQGKQNPANFAKTCKDEQESTNNQFTPEQVSVLDKHIDKFLKQKPADKVEPKFRIGDIITPKGKKEYYTIIDIVDGWYEFREKHVNGGIPIYYQSGWELVEQKIIMKEINDYLLNHQKVCINSNNLKLKQKLNEKENH